MLIIVFFEFSVSGSRFFTRQSSQCSVAVVGVATRGHVHGRDEVVLDELSKSGDLLVFLLHDLDVLGKLQHKFVMVSGSSINLTMQCNGNDWYLILSNSSSQSYKLPGRKNTRKCLQLQTTPPSNTWSILRILIVKLNWSYWMHIFKIKHQSKQLIKVESVVQTIVHSTYMVQMQLLPWR